MGWFLAGLVLVVVGVGAFLSGAYLPGFGVAALGAVVLAALLDDVLRPPS